jgi:ABC-type oligopeptide transport system substrate-binding subunit
MGRWRRRRILKLAQIQANQLDFAAAQGYYERAFALLGQMGGGETAVTTTPPPPFQWGMLADFGQNLDPAHALVSVTAELVGNLFEGLVELDNDLNIVPAVARRWEVDETGLHYKFYLRPEARWADGEPLTAEDFLFAWRRNLDPATGSPLAHLLYPIAGAEAFHRGQTADPATLGLAAPSAHLFEVTLAYPATYFPYLLASVMALPQPRHVVARDGEGWGRPAQVVGNGAWRVAESTAEALHLHRNPHYAGLATGNVQEVVVRWVEPNPSAYAQGVVDWCRVDGDARPPEGTLECQKNNSVNRRGRPVCLPFLGNHMGLPLPLPNYFVKAQSEPRVIMTLSSANWHKKYCPGWLMSLLRPTHSHCRLKIWAISRL